MPMDPDDLRPDPEKLLARAVSEEAEARRGRLKIFFGAAPGVGKTYAMLQEGRRLREQNIDVVAGLVETHGRPETESLLSGLEALPRREIDYHGHRLQEFDLDAALRRRPAVILVDELAHTNAPGCRHPKRWQDVQELLAAGIDVLTTVNVQHIESLNDVVQGISGIQVRETVPDRVFDAAGEVILVDLPPDDLLVRLKEGKVYVPEQAERAIQNFFRKGNLIALRELALRRTAERVDEQVLQYRHGNVREPVWQTADSLLVCVGPGEGDDKLVRTAARLAGKLNARWHAVYVETPDLLELPKQRRGAVQRILRLAEQLGAETALLAAPDAVARIIDYAREHNLGKVVVGRAHLRRFGWPWRKTFSRRLAERAPDIDILNIAPDPTARHAARNTADLDGGEAGRRPDRARYGYALLYCAGATLAAMPFRATLDLANTVMLFLLGVVWVGVRHGRGPALLMAVLSVASVDFFYVLPYLTFSVAHIQYLVTFVVMLAVGLVIGNLTAGLRYQARVAYHREERARILYELAKSLSSALTIEQVAEIGATLLEKSLKARATLLLPQVDGRLSQVNAAVGFPHVDLAVAQWCYDRGEPAGLGTDTLPASRQIYLPLKAPAQNRGVLVLEPHNMRILLVPEQRRLVETCAALIAIALERLHFVAVAQDSSLRIESERLRNSLLAAISHDLRTPLTALVGLSETLTRELQAAGSPQASDAAAIHDQGLRISRLVHNLLDMARLQSGRIVLRKDWQSVEEMVGGALKAMEPTIASHALELNLPAGLPLVRCDAALIERVLVNLLDNAVRHTPAGATIGIGASHDANGLVVEVWDNGPGLPEGLEQGIFDLFERVHKESAVPGAGLGLAICKTIVEAHGGQIRAANRPGGGASFTFTLPIETQPAIP